jgi:hypothetical protein
MSSCKASLLYDGSQWPIFVSVPCGWHMEELLIACLPVSSSNTFFRITQREAGALLLRRINVIGRLWPNCAKYLSVERK